MLDYLFENNDIDLNEKDNQEGWLFGKSHLSSNYCILNFYNFILNKAFKKDGHFY